MSCDIGLASSTWPIFSSFSRPFSGQAGSHEGPSVNLMLAVLGSAAAPITLLMDWNPEAKK